METRKKIIREKKPAGKKEAKPKKAKPILELAVENKPSEEIINDFSRGEAVEEVINTKGQKVKKYYEAVGRRKTAVARVRLFTIKPFEEDEGKITVNGLFYKEYFRTPELQQIVEASLRRLKSLNRFEATVKVKGSGLHSQAEALRHGLARVLVEFNLDFRKKLKKVGYLKRDPRAVERKKYGLKKARRAPQWAKR